MDTKKLQEEKILSGIVNEESRTYTFEKEISINMEKRKGTFTAKYLSLTDRLKIGTLRAKLLDGAPQQSVDGVTDDIAYMIAFLTVSLSEKPSWFNFDYVDDIEDLKSLYLEVAGFMNMFRNKNAVNSNVTSSKEQSVTETVENK